MPGVWNSLWVSHVGGRVICFPRCISREPGPKWSSQDLNLCSYGMPELQVAAQRAAPEWMHPNAESILAPVCSDFDFVIEIHFGFANQILDKFLIV